MGSNRADMYPSLIRPRHIFIAYILATNNAQIQEVKARRPGYRGFGGPSPSIGTHSPSGGPESGCDVLAIGWELSRCCQPFAKVNAENSGHELQSTTVSRLGK